MLKSDKLQCVRRHAENNLSRLVCSSLSGDEEELSARMYNALVTLTTVIVPLTVLLNLTVVLTVYMNRRLHTVINVLVIVLCVNNVIWVVAPILITVYPNFRGTSCVVNKFIFSATRSVMFFSIVTITLLRYLMVVKNHNYPAQWRNNIIFMSAAILPGAVHWAIQANVSKSECEKEIAWMSDGHAIFIVSGTTKECRHP